MAEINDTLEQEKHKEYFDMIFPEIKTDTLFKKKAREEDIKLPPIGDDEDNASDTKNEIKNEEEIHEEGEEELLQENEKKQIDDVHEGFNYSVLMNKVIQLEFALESLNLENRLQETRDAIMQKVDTMLFEISKKLNDLYDRKIPERDFYDTDGAYKEELYTIGCEVLDAVLGPLVHEIPDYSLISTQVSSVYDDGTVENALIAINVTLSNDGYRYDFKVDVPVLSGVVQTPLYIQRGQKLIPLTESGIARELESFSYRKRDIAYPYKKKNLFNNIGENPLRKPDTQKHYMTENKAQRTFVPENSKWDSGK